MDSFYLICFIVGLVFSVLTVVGGFGHLHLGHLRLHVGHHHAGSHGISAVNGFTITAFLCWFGGTGLLLHHASAYAAPIILLISVVSGLAGATLLWTILFKLLLPRERVLTTQDTEMTGILARVSDAIRDSNSTGEIIFSQTGARRASAARSEDGTAIQRGTEVVVIRYERGIAYVRPWDDLTNHLP